MPGRFGKVSSQMLPLSTRTPSTRWNWATSWARPIFCR
ncbi:Uncharacterised protein [Mycobacteroides abscessus subsp. abscessus]|nr:Uncharacterised protein [Mycobacteroides abscessus subsp. abscessus]